MAGDTPGNPSTSDDDENNLTMDHQHSNQPAGSESIAASPKPVANTTILLKQFSKQTMKTISPSPIIGKSNKIQKTSHNGSETNLLASATKCSADCCILTREDKKRLPFNFVNESINSWTIFKYLDHTSFQRNVKGTVITASLKKEHINDPNFLTPSEVTYTSNQGITYQAKFPRERTPFVGEILFDLHDIEDKTLLSLSEDQLLSKLTLPGNSLTNYNSPNKLLMVHKIFPRKVLDLSKKDEYEKTKTINLMKVSIECKTALPQRVFFQSVSLPVRPYITPPTRCFGCQRYSHGSVSCRRQPVCARCGSKKHQVTECESDEINCIMCGGPHYASSIKCPYYKAALAIAAKLQDRVISREMGAKLYADLYTDEPPKNTPQIIPTQQPYTQTKEPSLPSPRIRNPPQTQQGQGDVSQFSQSSNSQCYDSDIITPGQNTPDSSQQKKRKRQNTQTNKVPVHLTSSYRDALSGASWLNSEEFDELSLPPLSQPTPRERKRGMQESGSGDERDGVGQEPQDLWTQIKDMFVKAIKWLINKIVPQHWESTPMFQDFLKWFTSTLTTL